MEKGGRGGLKIVLFLTFTCCIAISPPLFAQTADNYFDQGKAYLENGQLTEANSSFQQALNLDPNHQGANLFYALTRILMISKSSDFNTLLDRAGVSSSGRDILDWSADFTRDPTGKILLPSNAPTSGELQAFLKNDVLPQVNGALTNLSNVTSSYQTTFELFTEAGTGIVNTPNTLTDNTKFWKINEFVGFNIIVSGVEFAITSNTYNTITVNPAWSFLPGNYSYKIVEPVRIDYGDVLAFQGTLTLAEAGIYILSAYNLDVNIATIVSLYNGGTLNIQTDIINAYPNLLNLLPDQQLAQAKSTLRDAFSILTSSINYIVGEPPSQERNLLVIDDPAKAQEYLNLLADLNSALDGTTLIRQIGQYANLSQFFDNPKVLRSYLPVFFKDPFIVGNTFPDPTFGGILPNMTSSALNDILKKYIANVVYIKTDGLCAGNLPCYPFIQNGIDSAQTNMIIEITGDTYYENVISNNPDVVILRGGWDSTFSTQPSSTAIRGSLTIGNGTMIIENIILQ